MKISEAFPSNYLKVDDLQNKKVQVTINSVSMEEVGDANKPVVYFKGKEKGLVLNKTNAVMIGEITGTEEMDNWVGHQIILFPARVDFQGKRVPAIRIEAPPNGKTAPAPLKTSVAAEENNDDIDF